MNIPISVYTTFGIGGPARELVIAKDKKALERAFGAIVLGRGSNVLVSDGGVDGKVVINRYEALRVTDVVTAGSGYPLCRLARETAAMGLHGLEWAVGIPGSVGGALRMNAGAFGHDIKEVVLYADIVRGGNVIRVERDGLALSYRSSALYPGDIVLEVTFLLKQIGARATDVLCREYAARRKGQPKGRSAGSVFKNPQGQSIAKLIDEAGFKGYRVGGACVSEEHANFIINIGGATAKDVVTIIRAIKHALAQKGVTAQEEIIYIGDF